MSYLLRDKTRNLLLALGILSAIFLPPWVPLLTMIALALLYPAWEIFTIGLFVDFVWSPIPGSEVFAQPFFVSLPLFTLAALSLAWGFEPLRREFLT